MVEPGQVLDGRYRLDARIAAGGMGEVWRGTDLALSRAVAIKLLHPEHARHPDGLARFRAEAQHAGSLSHPNIAQVYDYCEPAPPEPAYLVLELVDGPSLARALDDGPLSPERTLDVIEQAASGLAAAHRSGLLHRDIKPGNLLLSSEGLIKITDFGIARAAGSAVHNTGTGALAGTPAYLAPERFGGAPATPATDLYALGVVAHQCLTGQVPFAGEPLVVALAHVERDMPPLPDSVPAELADLVSELTRKDPHERPDSAIAVLARAGLVRASMSGPAGTPAVTSSLPLSFAGAGADDGAGGSTREWDTPAWGTGPDSGNLAGTSPAAPSPACASPAAPSPSAVGPIAPGLAAASLASAAETGFAGTSAPAAGGAAAGDDAIGEDDAGWPWATAAGAGAAAADGAAGGGVPGRRVPGRGALGRPAPSRRSPGRAVLLLAGLVTAGLAS
ncbi:MAG TPA: serine/threonine-protein kinase, partial [Streptosporangiaceae bacterium]